MSHHNLECIAIPITAHDVHSLETLFDVWNVYFDSVGSSASESITLLISVSCKYEKSIRESIDSILFDKDIVRWFESVRTEFIGIPPLEDIYLKASNEHSGELPALGRKNGPNKQFFETMRLCRQYNTTLYNETDLIPIRPDWLQRSVALIERKEHFLILGSTYKGKSQMPTSFLRHLNGNAFYATGHRGFVAGLLPRWESELETLCQELPSAAYDIWLSHEFHELLFGSKAEKKQMDYLVEIARYFYLSNDSGLIWNFSLPGDSLPIEGIEALASLGYLFVHGRLNIESAVAYSKLSVNTSKNTCL